MTSVTAPLQTMQIGDTRPIIDRNYRDITQPGQWLRECLVNADQAGAENVHFGIEWQGVESRHVYRRYVADDGCGMNAVEIDSFLRTYGGGGKTIGGAHDNFGIGAKIALLPWNPCGVLVVSYQGGQGHAVLLQGDDRNYGARTFADGRTVSDPNGLALPEFGLKDVGAIWQQVPFWAKRQSPPEHGTIFLLLGSTPSEDTFLGDPNHQEGESAYFPSLYLNTRLWERPAGQKVTIDVPQNLDKAEWPRRFPGQISPTGYGTLTGDKYLKLGRRNVRGARYYIDRGGKYATASGIVPLGQGAKAHWFLREQEPPKRDNPYAPRAGFIAVLYDGELYDVARAEDTSYRYRQFGVSGKEVMKRLFIVVEPPLKGAHGVYPTSGRDRLLLSGGQSLPFADWGAAFHDAMPDVIAEAVAEALQKEIVSDSNWKEKLFRFLPRLRQSRLRLVCPDENGEPLAGQATDYSPPPSDCLLGPRAEALGPATTSGPSGNGGGERGEGESRTEIAKMGQRRLNVSDRQGRERARLEQMRASIPSYRVAPASEFEQPYTLASWDPEYRHPEDGSVGCVLLNREHDVLVSLIEDIAKEYKVTPRKVAYWKQIESAVFEVVGQSLVAKVMQVRACLPPYVGEGIAAYLSDEALTTSGMGLIGEQQMLSQKIGGKFGLKKADKNDGRELAA